MKKINLFKNMTAAIAALFIVMFAMPQQAMAEKYNLWIAGVQVTSENCKDLSSIPGVSGTVKYNHSKKTLYLSDAKIETTADVHGIDSKIDGLTIDVTGDNTIKVGGFSAIRNDESRCTITGGKLYLSGEDFGLYVMYKASMTIENCTIESDGSVGTNNANAKMTIRNSKLTAKKKSFYASMMGIVELTLEGCAITQPTGAYYDSSLKGVALNGQLVTGKVVIDSYPVRIADINLNANDNLNDIKRDNIKSGKVSYNPDTRTLTLDNAVIEKESFGAAIWFCDNEITHAYTLVLKGNGNRLTSASAATLSTRSNLTITGGGSAQMTSEKNCGIFVNTDATLTITGGCSITAEGKWGIAGQDGNSETLIIDGATVKAKGTAGSICDLKEIQLKNCAITAPSGATVENGNVKLGGGICTDWVTIEPTEKYGIKIGDVEITADNYTDISASNGFPAVKSGTVSYNPATRTLTLDNVVIEPRKDAAIWFYDEEITHAYTLVLKGNGNRLTTSSAALATRSNLTITGGGSAQMTGKGDCGIYVYNAATLTITGGCSITAEGMYGIAGNDGESETLIIDGATVKAKGNGTKGSVCDFKEIVLKNCAITAPSGATVAGGNVKLGGKVVTDWVTIEPTETGIDTPTADVPARKQGVYNLQGVRLGTSLDRLPKGIYIVDGRKVVKK